MIRAIRRIENYRIFKGWVPEPGTPNWESVNVVYGVNGSGKSTLASLLEEFAAGSTTAGLRIEVEDGSGRRTVADPSDPITRHLHVFNAAYVERNLKFDEPDNQVVPLLVLGEQAVDVAERTAEAEARLREVQSELPRRRGLAEEANARAQRQATACAQIIIADLETLGGRYAGRSYRANQVKQVMGQVRGLEPLSAEALEADLALVKSRPLARCPVPNHLIFDTADLVTKARELLAATVTAVAIDELQSNGAAAAWAQAGLPLHEHRETCLFCAGPLTPERWQALDRHFDESARSMQRSLDGLIESVGGVRDAAASAVRALPDPQLLHESVRPSFVTARASAVEDLERFAQDAARLIQELERKKHQLFTALELEVEVSPLDIQAAVEELEGHNSLCDSFAERVQAAARRIELERVRAVAEDYEQALSEARTAQEAAERLREEEAQLVDTLRELGRQDLDPLPLAEELNDDLARLLGRSDLSLTQGDAGFTVCRNGQPARHLSEGERTALSLLYFIKSLSRHGASLADAIAIIDDPVSSLDGNIVAGVSAHLWARLVAERQCRQVIMLTHNFELFRMWSNLLDRLSSRAGISFTIQEIRVRSRNVDSTVRRIPYFKHWPQDRGLRNRLRSEYHYLYWRAASTLISCKTGDDLENELDAAAILPNVCRRLLEGFLAFRYPQHLGNLRNGLEEAAGTIDDSVTRTRILNFLHQYSHNEEAYTGRDIARPETLTVLTAVFELIAYCDRPHFDAMCRSLDLDMGVLLSEP